MRPTVFYMAFFAICLSLAACGRSCHEEAEYVYEEGLLLNDDLVAYHVKDGTVSIFDPTRGKVTIKDIDLEWSVPSPHDSLAVFCSDGKRGYYNVFTGEIAVPAQYRRAWIFRDGLAAVQKNGNIGFINHKGEIVIDFLFPYHGNPLYEFIFDDGHCVVADTLGKCGVIDLNGEWLIPAEYDKVNSYKEYAIVTKDGVTIQMGYDGKPINTFVLDDFEELTYQKEELVKGNDGSVSITERKVNTGMFAYCIGGRYGLMDGATLKKLTDPVYKEIRAVSKTMFLAYLLDCSSQVILDENGVVMK